MRTARRICDGLIIIEVEEAGRMVRFKDKAMRRIPRDWIAAHLRRMRKELREVNALIKRTI